MQLSETKRVKVGEAVYIINHLGQVLLLKRKGNHAPGTWCPPGGKIELGESFLDCAKREVLEETGLRIKSIAILGVTNDYYNKDNHWVSVNVLAKGFSGQPEIMEPDKCEEIGWFNLDSLPSPLMLSAKNFLRDFSDKLKVAESLSL